MADQMPVMQKKSGPSPWLIGCGLGCGAILLIGIIAVVGIGVLMRVGLEGAKTELAEDLNREYAKMKEEERVPLEHQPLFDEIVAIGAGEESSFMAAVAAMSVVSATLEDGEVSEGEAETAQAILDLLRENPDFGFMDIQRILEEHPELKKLFEEHAGQLDGFNPVLEENDSLEDAQDAAEELQDLAPAEGEVSDIDMEETAEELEAIQSEQ